MRGRVGGHRLHDLLGRKTQNRGSLRYVLQVYWVVFSFTMCTLGQEKLHIN